MRLLRRLRLFYNDDLVFVWWLYLEHRLHSRAWTLA